jgi:hypothetical protein
MMDDQELMTEIRRHLTEGKLSCADAHAVAEETGETLARIGALCDAAEPRVKIKGCQLGCF